MRVCLYPVVTDVQPETYQKPVVVNFQQNTPAICNKFPEALGCTSLMDHTLLISSSLHVQFGKSVGPV
jgi:hypothetical protein